MCVFDVSAYLCFWKSPYHHTGIGIPVLVICRMKPIKLENRMLPHCTFTKQKNEILKASEKYLR